MEYRDMVAYVDTHNERVLDAIKSLSVQFAEHEQWHRQTLEKQIASASGAWRRRGVYVAIASSLLSGFGVTIAEHLRIH